MRGAASVKILRVIGRLNIGGPAQHAIWLSAALQGERFETLLVTGRPDASEGDLAGAARAHAIPLRVIPELGRAIRPLHDVTAFVKLFRIAWLYRPDILHTHTAKAGTHGRLVGLALNALRRFRVGSSPRRRCVLVHTFHGHVFDGYFAPWLTRLFIWIERWLAARTDVLVTVSESVKAELVRLRIAPANRITVIPLGVSLEPFLQIREFGTPALPAEGWRVGIVGRLVPIKSHELFFEMASRLRRDEGMPPVRFIVVGDGPRRALLERYASELGIAADVVFEGWRADLPVVYAGLDVVCLTSRNEGTPVSLIEAMAAGRAVVATDVGGVRDLLGPPLDDSNRGVQVRAHGMLVCREEGAEGLACGLRRLLQDAALRRRLGESGRAFVREHYSLQRLVRDITQLYEGIMS